MSALHLTEAALAARYRVTVTQFVWPEPHRDNGVRAIDHRRLYLWTTCIANGAITTEPSEADIYEADSTFPMKTKRPKTDRVQKWREVKSKLVLSEDLCGAL
ncbi:hypothetical protein Bbelb_109030 [Branchiostoma belcheri]|nr:hypothetical protein Bbelb_109030 [Branchiostoma belcheri]